MSIELTEKDIKAIARKRARLPNKAGWGIAGIAALWFVSVGVACFATGECSSPVAPSWTAMETTVVIGGAILLCLLIPILVITDRREKRILKQLKQEHGE